MLNYQKRRSELADQPLNEKKRLPNNKIILKPNEHLREPSKLYDDEDSHETTGQKINIMDSKKLPNSHKIR